MEGDLLQINYILIEMNTPPCEEVGQRYEQPDVYVVLPKKKK